MCVFVMERVVHVVQADESGGEGVGVCVGRKIHQVSLVHPTGRTEQATEMQRCGAIAEELCGCTPSDEKVCVWGEGHNGGRERGWW